MTLARFLAISTLVSWGAVAQAADTDREIAALVAANKAVISSFEQALVDGDLALAKQRLLDGFPEKRRTPIEELLLGEMLFPVDEQAAAPFLARAAQRLATPEAYRELAIAQQRAGDCQGALTSWERYLAKVPDLRFHALVAECRARAGDPQGALAAWNRARHPENHVEIETAISYIHGKPHPDRRRDELFRRIQGGDEGAAAELLALDGQFDTDWWNDEPNAERLDRDLARLKKLFASKTALRDELERFARLVRAGEGLTDELRKARWIVSVGSHLLPSPLARAVVARLDLQKGDLAASILRAHDTELRRRAKAGDKSALDLLAALLAATNRMAELHAVDQEGWERFHDARYAASFVVSQPQPPKSTDDPALKKAIKEFPTQSVLRAVWLRLAEKDEVTVPKLLELIVAEFHEPMGLMARHDSYRLKGYFALLEERLSSTSEKRD